MFDLLKDLWGFMKERKKFWLAPIVIILVLLGGQLFQPLDKQENCLHVQLQKHQVTI